MKFSTQEEYGLRCAVQIARSGGALTIPEISRREGLSSTHVAKLLMLLRQGGFVASTRGQAGGYTLARPAEAILVKDVLAKLGGQLYDERFCVRHAGLDAVCRHAVDCTVRSLWQEVQEAVDQVLAGVTVRDLVLREEAPASQPNVTFFDERPMAHLS